jgi:hypothetical protein
MNNMRLTESADQVHCVSCDTIIYLQEPHSLSQPSQSQSLPLLSTEKEEPRGTRRIITNIEYIQSILSQIVDDHALYCNHYHSHLHSQSQLQQQQQQSPMQPSQSSAYSYTSSSSTGISSNNNNNNNNNNKNCNSNWQDLFAHLTFTISHSHNSNNSNNSNSGVNQLRAHCIRCGYAISHSLISSL